MSRQDWTENNKDSQPSSKVIQKPSEATQKRSEDLKEISADDQIQILNQTLKMIEEERDRLIIESKVHEENNEKLQRKIGQMKIDRSNFIAEKDQLTEMLNQSYRDNLKLKLENVALQQCADKNRVAFEQTAQHLNKEIGYSLYLKTKLKKCYEVIGVEQCQELGLFAKVKSSSPDKNPISFSLHNQHHQGEANKKNELKQNELPQSPNFGLVKQNFSNSSPSFNKST